MLNVWGEDPWACYYTDFPIVSIHSGRVLGWRGGVPFASAFIELLRFLAIGQGPALDVFGGAAGWYQTELGTLISGG
ncbi:hypothetical protein [Actinocrispum sp. NPDC049592]|uniref:hypothetical protein n=1 Tax=Actinocrispum sp. NPDC049592 TaxID=3154835 RepID=UPI00342CF455